MKGPLKIGAYHLQKNARSEAHIKAIADCGIDYIIGLNRDYDTLDLFEKYGLGAIVEGAVPGWWGGLGENAGKLRETNPPEKYDEKAAEFRDHPAIIGVCTGDEPSALDFPYYGQVIEKVRSLFPGKIPYLNLYASYGVTADCPVPLPKQFGTATYEEHIEEYLKHVPLEYLSFDHYPYSATPEGYIENLRIASEACRKSGREMWVVMQVNSSKPEEWITENQLRFQAFTALAYGADRITWACYCAGWWHNQVLDGDGNKTEQYEKLKQVNGEVKELARLCEGRDFIRGHRVNKEETLHICGVTVSADCPLVVGELDGALFICATDDPLDKSPTVNNIIITSPSADITVFNTSGKETGTKTDNGKCIFTLPSSGAAVVFIK